MFPLAESTRPAAAAEEGPRLFENLPDHNPSGEITEEGGFPIFSGRNPLKRLDSEK
jgi:hypothetical protein